MTSQNNKLRNQNTQLHNEVDHYKEKAEKLERKLDKFKKKAEMAELVSQLANHSISPLPPTVADITQQTLTFSTLEVFSSPIPAPVVEPSAQTSDWPAMRGLYKSVLTAQRSGIQVVKCLQITSQGSCTIVGCLMISGMSWLIFPPLVILTQWVTIPKTRLGEE
jgi:hypothetical protein